MRQEVVEADLQIYRDEARSIGFSLVRRLYLRKAHRIASTNPLQPFTQMMIGRPEHFEEANALELERRFIDPFFGELWYACRERFWAFEEGIAKLKSSEIAEFNELPHTVREVALGLYEALRWADLMHADIAESEAKPWLSPGLPEFHPGDRQASALYAVAEKNVQEYERNYQELTGGIERTKAQASVFITTLDALRLKMLSYRHVGRDPSLGSRDFLAALAEARAQLSAIDKALDEVDLSHYPTTVSYVEYGGDRAVVESA
jgi:hypothetical protein